MLWAHLGKYHRGGCLFPGLGRIVRTPWVTVRGKGIKGERGDRSERREVTGVVLMLETTSSLRAARVGDEGRGCPVPC